jgi:GAF domain-containing protein
MENLLNPGVGRTLMSPVELQEGIACLSRGAYFKEASFDMMLTILTESAAQMSGVERVSIWALNNEHQELLCLDLFELSSRRHSKGERLLAGQYPIYFQALHAGSSISADDAYIHPLTTEFAADYLMRHGVTAVLDTPIHIRGELQGVLCLEQVGSRQPWTSAHGLFAQAVANLVTLALVENEAEEARRQAQAASERLKAVFDASRDAEAFSGGNIALCVNG